MNNQGKTKAQLLAEIGQLQQRMKILVSSEAERKNIEEEAERALLESQE